MILNSIIGNELKQVKRIILDVRTDSEDLLNVLNNFLNRESKLIRTITACLFFKSFDEDINENQLRILAATEIIHNASLIHDDTIDGSVLRRGAASINKEFDGKLSVIAGDFLMSKAVEELLKLGNNDILKIFFETITKMCEGESEQYFSRNLIPSVDDYLKKTQYKTAELFKSCFVAMAFYSRSSMIKEAREFALNFGTAFQIKNDLEDYKLGVENSEDVKGGIYTLPVIYTNAVEDNEIAIEKTLNLIHNYCEKAKSVVDIAEDNVYKRTLIEIIDKLWN